MKKFTIKLAGALLIMCAMFTAYSCGGAAKDKALELAVEQMNSACPMQVDEITTFEKVELAEGREMVMTYTVNIDKNGEDFDLNAFQETMKKTILDGVKSPGFASLRQMEVTATYKYSDKNGEDLLEYSVTPEMYK